MRDCTSGERTADATSFDDASIDERASQMPADAPPLLIEHAPAKVNLTLRVLGRRADGYHELESLVAFAHCGDEVCVLPDAAPRLEVDGPFAAGLDGPPTSNLVWRAIEAALQAAPGMRTGAFRLTKRLPVASGIGGGSSDAAAAIRLLQRLDPDAAAHVDWQAIAIRLGADVPVCLGSRAAMMSGIGEEVSPLPELPPLWCVLVNPRVPLATRDVFHALGAPPFDGARLESRKGVRPPTGDIEALLTWIAAQHNDLEGPALRLCPAVADVLAALRQHAGTRVARMSGSGATCFGLCASKADAITVAAKLRAAHAGWWVEAAPAT